MHAFSSSNSILLLNEIEFDIKFSFFLKERVKLKKGLKQTKWYNLVVTSEK